MIKNITFHAIVAMSKNRVIGNKLHIPWHLSDDLRWFKKKTMHHSIVMGRKTFESIGKTLHGRHLFVMSRSGFSYPNVYPNVTICRSLDEIPFVKDQVCFICGGAEIYRMALPFCSDLFLTYIKREVIGDCYFPSFEDDFYLESIIEENEDFDIKWYKRNQVK